MNISGQTPRRPQGNNNEAVFAQAVWDRNFGANPTATGYGLIPHRPTFTPHPFMLYVCPDETTGASDWRKFRVHAGYVSIDWEDPVAVTGTDADATPASIEVPADEAKYWFWLDLSTPATPTIDHGTDPQTWSSTKIPIGYVNTEEEYAATIPLQMITTNLFTCS
jgi:hypothetical protein